VGDWSQGVRVENARSLVDYWERGYDWRRFESELNRFPQFLTEIDGLDIHFIHVRSKNPNAMPLILTHGWPGSIVEFLKLIGPLTDPVSFGGDAADSFDVVVPSLPGFGFSGKPTETGWTVSRIGSAAVLSGNSSPAMNNRNNPSRPRKAYRDSAKAAIEPSTTASAVATTAMIALFWTARQNTVASSDDTATRPTGATWPSPCH
jgi:pimeloyl-ACP methyl ester carboxylesterase